MAVLLQSHLPHTSSLSPSQLDLPVLLCPCWSPIISSCPLQALALWPLMVGGVGWLWHAAFWPYCWVTVPHRLWESSTQNGCWPLGREKA